MLIECGANAAICDSMGRNPLMCSLNFGVDDLAKLLVTKGGANVNAVDDQGDCVLKSAFLSPSSRKLNAYLRMAQSGPSEPVSIVGSARMVKFLVSPLYIKSFFSTANKRSYILLTMFKRLIYNHICFLYVCVFAFLFFFFCLGNLLARAWCRSQSSR